MAENLIAVAASLGISSITCLIFWFCSMFPGALTDFFLKKKKKNACSWT
jgi:hypothetical protein